ncbi:hypothetical protein PENSPDRAFT_681281 [Peniophora sp. CONT]|nr:hypothetical protein PENSPDRAFT_681281 [Peniophora sp. CONT]
MTIFFKRIRIAYFSTIFILSAAVLGLSAYFANIYLPDNKAHAGFSIYAVVIAALTIVFGLIQLFSGAQPRTEAPFLFVVSVFWLSVAAWAIDQSTNEECYGLGNAQTPTENGLVSSRSICYAIKIVEAFSWTIFAMLVIAFVIVINRTASARVLGHPDAWSEPMDNLPWYDELPGYPGGSWFGSDYHRYHHRYGYETFASTGPVAASRRGYKELSPTGPMLETSRSVAEDHYTRARGKSSHRRVANTSASNYGESPSMVPGMAPSGIQPGRSMGYGQAQLTVPMAATQPGASVGYGQVPSIVPTTQTTGVGATVKFGEHEFQQKPGHSMIIRGGAKGGPPQIEQVPGYYRGP